LKTTKTGLVLAVVATTPLVVIPFSYAMEGEKVGLRSVAGGLVAVAGVIFLLLVHKG
jgi:drug/metabolite transporter (DMT)-like permease